MSKNCKYCGAGNLHWEQTLDRKWQLLDSCGNKHKCVITKKVSASIPTKKLDITNDSQINEALKVYKKQLDKEKKKVYRLNIYE